MATVTKKSTLPYYCAAAVWVLYALLFPLYTMGQLLTAGIGSALMFFVMNALCPPIEVEVEEKPVEEKPTGNEALDKMLKEGNMALAEMQRLDDSIQDEKISADIQTLKEICGKIFQQVKNDPAKLPEIRRFMNYYLPTTLKLLNSYDRMGAQGISGENIDATMDKVEGMMDTIVKAFEKQLDSLFGAEAMDISTDITVLETMMAREGLTEQEMKAETTENVDLGDIKLEL
ncbi:MAG: 5-bromo-4-chloroindolyl phosphate hydrolysis family protein [Oscillospiraceae bacterium]|nr:5-bromo-4-chloroindolyl phosphate hydrolysis family protein [Oscillospiraceae bacterium]